MPYKEKEPEKMFYSIGEVSKMFNVKTSLIRFWENQFDIIRPHKNNKGNRLFTKNDIDNFHLIYHLVKEMGLTLKGAKKKISDNKEGIILNFEIIKSLKDIKDQLLEIRDNLP